MYLEIQTNEFRGPSEIFLTHYSWFNKKFEVLFIRQNYEVPSAPIFAQPSQSTSILSYTDLDCPDQIESG